jgi:hypothetical protein
LVNNMAMEGDPIPDRMKYVNITGRPQFGQDTNPVFYGPQAIDELVKNRNLSIEELNNIIAGLVNEANTISQKLDKLTDSIEKVAELIAGKEEASKIVNDDARTKESQSYFEGIDV